MPVPPLPYETLAEIVQNVDRPTLIALLLTSPPLKSIAEPLLYHTVELYSPSKTLQFLLSTTSRTDDIINSIHSCQSLMLSDHSLGATYRLVRRFLEHARNLHTLSILGPEPIPPLSPSALPNLRIAGGSLEILADILPGRPVEEIIITAADTAHESWRTLLYLSATQKSTKPIQALTIVTGATTNPLLLGVSLYVTSLFLSNVKHLMLNFVLPQQFARELLGLIANSLRDHKELVSIGIVNWDPRGTLDDLETQLFFIKKCLEHSPSLEHFEFPFTKFHRWRDGEAGEGAVCVTGASGSRGTSEAAAGGKWIRMEKFELCGGCGCGCQCSCSEVDLESGRVAPLRQAGTAEDDDRGEGGSEEASRSCAARVESAEPEVGLQLNGK